MISEDFKDLYISNKGKTLLYTRRLGRCDRKVRLECQLTGQFTADLFGNLTSVGISLTSPEHPDKKYITYVNLEDLEIGHKVESV